ncbi:amidohydrolase [uncultured Phycicoccus sp.]|uniref:amidohydrolase n=1 Tax=uncultured Phycicoccus sp. TaxID=661422 RepID=UPI00345C1DD0
MVDIVFSGGPVFTARAVRSRPIAVAVDDGRVVAVGHDEVLELAGPRTERVDLRGRMLVPGFQDAHVHPVWAGVDMLRCDLTDLSTAEQYVRRVADYAAATADQEWVLGSGWSMSAFPGGTPTAAALDAVVGDRPAFLPNRDGHGAWVSSAALRRAGIDRDTPDPRDGRIERDADGTPSGTLHEGAMALVGLIAPETTDEERLEGLLRAQAHLHSLGITAWQDAIIGDYGDGGNPATAYRLADESGRLTARVVGALWWDRNAGLGQVPEIIDRRERLSTARFRATSVKIMQDGVPENFTAAMLDPYCDGHGRYTDNSGISFVPVETLMPAAEQLDAAGFQLHFHAIGDRAVRECLDAVEGALRANGRRDARHHIAHIQVIHPEDLHRFRELGVVANMQAFWAALEAQMVELTMPFLGEPRSSWQYPFGDLQRSGAALAMGSDWAVSTADPLAAIHVAVTRQIPEAYREGEPEHPVFLPEQRIDLATALTAYTAGSAHVNRLDDTGQVRVGALADLAVLDRDPFAGPPEEIGTTRVLQTFVDGRRVYAADDA